MMREAMFEGSNRWNVLPFGVDTGDGWIEVLVAPGSQGDVSTPEQVHTNGSGLTSGPGMVNGLGLTNAVPGRDIEPLTGRGGFTNGRDGAKEGGLELRRDLINGFSIRPESTGEEPNAGWGPKAQRRRKAHRRLGEMSELPFP